MEDANRKSNRVLAVERGFGGSRLEGERMTTAYEHVSPFVRVATGGSPTEQPEPGIVDRIEATDQEQPYAAGA